MSYPINYPTPQGANVQIFTTNGLSTTAAPIQTWMKPQGASFVWFTLIGAGGAGDNVSTGGGSGAVTNFMCPAFLIPDQLRIELGVGGTIAQPSSITRVSYQQKTTTAYTLLSASAGGAGGTGGVGGAAMTANNFTAMGFFQSINGQDGTSGAIAASGTTFLSGGGRILDTQNSNYGYSSGPSTINRSGFFQTQPIIVGAGGMGSGIGGTGCGGGIGGGGGSSMVVIITW
jgi:hypothetical protein